MVSWSDASHEDSWQAHGMSVTGFVATVDGTAWSWISRRQTVSATSTTESEITALHHAAAQTYVLRQMTRSAGIHINQATRLSCDNLAAVDMATNPKSTKRTKHLALKYWSVSRAPMAGDHARMPYSSAT